MCHLETPLQSYRVRKKLLCRHVAGASALQEQLGKENGRKYWYYLGWMALQGYGILR
jgi:hypothetical protein